MVQKSKQVWFDEPEIRRVSDSSKERIVTFFEVESRAVTVGYILHKLKIDFRTIKRVLAVMMKYGLVEKIEATSYTHYRAKR